MLLIFSCVSDGFKAQSLILNSVCCDLPLNLELLRSAQTYSIPQEVLIFYVFMWDFWTFTLALTSVAVFIYYYLCYLCSYCFLVASCSKYNNVQISIHHKGSLKALNLWKSKVIKTFLKVSFMDWIFFLLLIPIYKTFFFLQQLSIKFTP